MLPYMFHVQKAFIWGMLANMGFRMPAEGAIVVIVGLTSSVGKGAGTRLKNIFFLKIAYILENIDTCLQLIHKLEQDMKE